MPVKITIEGCCEGTGENCQKWHCAVWHIAERVARERKGPRIATGFGDANPVRDSDILAVVKDYGYDELLKKNKED